MTSSHIWNGWDMIGVLYVLQGFGITLLILRALCKSGAYSNLDTLIWSRCIRNSVSTEVNMSNVDCWFHLQWRLHELQSSFWLFSHQLLGHFWATLPIVKCAQRDVDAAFPSVKAARGEPFPRMQQWETSGGHKHSLSAVSSARGKLTLCRASVWHTRRAQFGVAAAGYARLISCKTG